jgi:hypothetical protein
MKRNAWSRRRGTRRNWEREALARVVAHVAAIDGAGSRARELGWESAAFERLRSLLRR